MKLLAIHLQGTFVASREAARAMLAQGGGAIVNLGSLAGNMGLPRRNAYGAAKAGIHSMTRSMAVEWGRGGIRVNAISAGPIRTLAASGIGDFRYILRWNEYNSPLRRTVTIEEVGDSGFYLLSDLGRGVTGEILHVDAGYHIVGMKNPDAPDITVNGSGE